MVNLRWAANDAVEVGEVCSFQGIVRQLGGVSTSIWSVVIALHLFNLLFWRWEPRKYSCYATCLACWSLAGMVVFIGPTTVRTNSKGDFWGVAGMFCLLESRRSLRCHRILVLDHTAILIWSYRSGVSLGMCKQFFTTYLIMACPRCSSPRQSRLFSTRLSCCVSEGTSTP